MSICSTDPNDREGPKSEARALLQDYLTEPELADQIGVTVRTLQMWRSKRQGPCWTNLGKRVIYRRGGVADWLKSQEQQPVRSRRGAA